MSNSPERTAGVRAHFNWLQQPLMVMVCLTALSLPARSQTVPPSSSVVQRQMEPLVGNDAIRTDRATATGTSPTAVVPVADSEFLKLRPQFISVADLAKALQLAIGNQGSLAVLDSQDVVLVAGPPHVLQRATYMMDQVDTPRLQVRLTVYLFDVEVNELKKLELAAASRWKPPTDYAKDETSQFHVLANYADLRETLKLLSECPDAKLLADPQLTVVDRQSSSFNLVTRIPVTHAATVDRSGASGLTSFEEVGVRLSLTPRFSSNSSVELRVAPQYSSITGYNPQGNPVIDVRSADTTLRVSHNQTVVIGGLRRRFAVESIPSTAGLMNRKVVEPLFRSNVAEPIESEMICIIRTEIVGNEQVASHASKSQLTAQPNVIPGMATGMVAVTPLREDGAPVQSGAYQEPLATGGIEPVKPSAYRPSVYNKPSATQSAPRKNINSSRNSVTQPLPLPSRQR